MPTSSRNLGCPARSVKSGNIPFPDGGFQGDVLAVQLNRHILKSDEKQVAFIVAVQCIAFDDVGGSSVTWFVLEVESLGIRVSGGAGPLAGAEQKGG